MEPTENIKRLLKKLNFDADPQTHKRILDDTLAAQAKTKTLENSAASAAGIWRTIMKSSITKLAAAAMVVVVSAIAGIHHLRTKTDAIYKVQNPTLQGVSAIPVGGKIDTFLSDKNPKAIAFRQAWKEAVEEDGQLEHLPKDVNGEMQRQRVIDAYEKAIAIMPDAPLVPNMLLRMAYLWNSPAVAPEEPNKAMEIYDRIIADYPNAYKAVLQAFSGLAASYILKNELENAIVWHNAILEYNLPSDAELELKLFAEKLKQEATQHIKGLNVVMQPVDVNSVGIEEQK